MYLVAFRGETDCERGRQRSFAHASLAANHNILAFSALVDLLYSFIAFENTKTVR